MGDVLYDPERIDPIIELLRARWKANPHMRFGQLLVNMSYNTDLFHLADFDLRQLLKEYG